jgi:hypothetical protein
MIPSKLLPLGALLLFVSVLVSCSSTTNTISGISTVQSTISGSNYLFFVDPESGRLVSHLDGLKAGERIRAGDYFSVYLDFGFVRYLQAVDPYVIVYSETWMGNKPRPTDSEKTLRQVVLLKEGMAPNARLPLTSIPILGPVTMGDDLLDVYVTLKVVVLSKKDNAQTIQLVEGLAGQAAAAPQFSAIAGATAATVAAFIAQNRDKVEFEHTFAFSPDGFLSVGVTTTPHFSQTILREGQVVVIKGESRFRSIPYPNWYYYLYPLNWFGLSPDGVSRRFESDEAPQYTPIGEIIRIPAYAIGSLFSDARSDASFLNFLFPGVADGPATTPSDIALEGYHLVKCNVKNAKGPGDAAAVKGTGKGECKLDNMNAGKSTEILSKLGDKLMKLARFVPFIGEPSTEQQTTNIYSEKTHFVVRIQKTKGTLGTFDELLSHFSEHAATINEVTTTSSESRRISQARIEEAFKSAKDAILYDRTKQQIRDEAKRGAVKEPDLSNVPDEKDKESLLKLSIKEHVYYTEKKIMVYAKGIGDNPQLFQKVVEYIQHLRATSWETTLRPSASNQDLWLNGWKLVLENIRSALSNYPQFSEKFSWSTWDNLISGTNQTGSAAPVESEKESTLEKPAKP